MIISDYDRIVIVITHQLLVCKYAICLIKAFAGMQLLNAFK